MSRFDNVMQTSSALAGGKHPADRLKMLYIIALGLIAFLTVASQLVVQRALLKQQVGRALPDGTSSTPLMSGRARPTRSKETYVSPLGMAVIYVGLGEKNLVFRWLERAYEERCTGMTRLRASPTFDSLRSDARFDDLLRRIGFPLSALGETSSPGERPE